MNEKIAAFLSKQTVASISCVNEENEPYCFSCFFVFDSKNQLIHYKSSPNAYHSQLLQKQPAVAGTVLPDKLNTLAIKGVQFTGEYLPAANPLCEKGSSLYHKKYPFAVAMPGEIWTIRVDSIKMTDNSLGFSKKLVWQREVQLTEM